jgi:hypothetical protein
MMPGTEAPDHIASSRLQRGAAWTEPEQSTAMPISPTPSHFIPGKIQSAPDVPPVRTNPTVIGWYPLRTRPAQELTPIHIRGLLTLPASAIIVEILWCREGGVNPPLPRNCKRRETELSVWRHWSEALGRPFGLVEAQVRIPAKGFSG